MPPALTTIVGHALTFTEEEEARTTATDTTTRERPITLTEGSDIVIRLHVNGGREVKGTILRDLEASPNVVSTTTKQASYTWETRNRVFTTRSSSQQQQTMVMDNPAFKTSRVMETSRPSTSYARTMSTPVSAPVDGWISRAPIQQPTHLPMSTHAPTPAPISGGRISQGPISNITLGVLITAIVLAVWFAYHVLIINCCGGRSFGATFWVWKKHMLGQGVAKHDAKDNKFDDRKLHPILHDGGNGRPGNSSSSSSLQKRECNRINMRKASLRSASYVSSSSSGITSPPHTPRASSYSEFAPQAVTSSSAYNTPSATPVLSNFPSTNFPPTSLRHRSHVPRSLVIESPSPTTNTTTGVDLEDQTPISTPRFAVLHPGVSGNLGGLSGLGREDLEVKEEGKTKLSRIGSSRWVADIVDRVGDKFVRHTRGEGSFEGPRLPVNEW